MNRKRNGHGNSFIMGLADQTMTASLRKKVQTAGLGLVSVAAPVPCLLRMQLLYRANPRSRTQRNAAAFLGFSTNNRLGRRKSVSICVRRWTRRCAKETRGMNGGLDRAGPPIGCDETAQRVPPS